MRHLPYTTKSGLQIGCRYNPPLKNHITPDGEFWQGVFLGYRRTPAIIKITAWAVYLLCLTACFVLLALFAR